MPDLEITHPQIYAYLEETLVETDPVLREMGDYGRAQGFPIIGVQPGRMLHFLARAINAKHVLELGSGFGYSAMWFALAVGEGGKVIMTDGKDGVVYGEAGKVVKVAGFTVPVVDTTGAGDTFNGAFATARCEGLAIKEAIRFANAAAALSVGKIGAQGGMPWRKEVEEMLSCRK